MTRLEPRCSVQKVEATASTTRKGALGKNPIPAIWLRSWEQMDALMHVDAASIALWEFVAELQPALFRRSEASHGYFECWRS